MRIPEKTLLGISGVLLLLNGLHGAMRWYGSSPDTLAQHTQAYAAGYSVGAVFGFAVSLFCGLGLLALLVGKFRQTSRTEA